MTGSVAICYTFTMSETLTKGFKGLLYGKTHTPHIADIVCPPYDVIPDRDIYYKRNPVNAIRLELPREQDGLDSYGTAKNTLNKWLADGTLAPDKEEAIYVYEQEFEAAGNSYFRRGFIGLNKLDKKRILTHEETRKKAKADREQLIGTLKTYTSFIFGLYEDKEEELEAILAGSGKELLYDFIDEQSIRNRFFRMTDKAGVSALVDAMDRRNIYIADGHHRLDVSYRLGVPYAPIYLCNMYSRGIVILPYHRTINFENARPLQGMLNDLGKYADVQRIPYENNETLRRALDDISKLPQPAFVFYSKDDKGNLYIVKERESVPAYAAEDVHNCLKELKVNVIHSGIIKKLLNIKDEEISFTQDHFGSADEIKAGSLDLAFFLPPTTADEVKGIADNSLFMPPKSTFFYPKILTGLVFYQYA